MGFLAAYYMRGNISATTAKVNKFKNCLLRCLFFAVFAAYQLRDSFLTSEKWLGLRSLMYLENWIAAKWGG